MNKNKLFFSRQSKSKSPIKNHHFSNSPNPNKNKNDFNLNFNNYVTKKPEIYNDSMNKNLSPKSDAKNSSKKPITIMKDFKNYATATDFFVKIYNDKSKMAQTFYLNSLKKNDSFSALNFEKDEDKINKEKEISFSSKILKKIAKISEISDILEDNSFDIINLMQSEDKDQIQLKKLTKDLKYREFIDIIKSRFSKALKIFKNFILNKILTKEGPCFVEVGKFIEETLSKCLENLDHYYIRHEEIFTNINFFKDQEIKVENKFYEALYRLLDYYNFYNHENKLFGNVKPSEEALIYAINQYKKTLFKDNINKKASNLFEDLENVLKNSFNKILALKDELKGILEENKKLTELYAEKSNIKKEENINILMRKRENAYYEINSNNKKDEEFNKSSKKGMMAMAVEELYANSLQSTKKEKFELQENFNKLLIKCKRYKEKNDKLLLDFTTLKSRRSKETSDKNVECNFYKDNLIEKNSNKLINIILNPHDHIVFAFKQSKEWTLAAINLMINEKMIADLQDEAEKRPRQNFQNYVIEWFLRRFGNKNLAEIFLKDFLLSLRTLSAKSERFKIISELINVEWNPLQEVIQASSINNKFNKNVIRSKFYSTNEFAKVYMKIVCSLQNSQMKFKEKSFVYPFLPNILIKGHDMIPFDNAKYIMETILTEEEFNIEKIKEIEKSLRELILNDPNKSDELYTDQIKIEDECIRFDYFIRFLLEQIFENKVLEIENIYSVLKLKNSTKSDGLITFEDFANALSQLYPKRSLRWMECSYKSLIDGVKSDATSLNLSLRYFLPWIYNEYSSLESYLKIKNLFINSPYNTFSYYSNLSFQKPIEEADDNKFQSSSPKKKPSKTTIKKNSNDKNKNEDRKELNLFNEFLSNLFDCISSLALLEESYRIIKHIIIQSERNNSSLMTLHDEFKQDLMKLPSNILKMKTYEVFNNYDKKDLMYLIENIWKKFKSILCLCFNF